MSLLSIHPWVSHLIVLLIRRQHPRMISTFLRSLFSAFKTRRALGLENLALRQQVAVLRRSVKRLRLSNVDRVFMGASVSDLDGLEAATRWHRSGFNRY